MNKKLSKIKIFFSDVDGIMTDARIWMIEPGKWNRMYCVLDGMGLLRLQDQGIKTAILTASNSEDVKTRFKFLKVDHFYDGLKSKSEMFEKVLAEEGLKPEEAAYMGDDLMDIPVLQAVGWSASVPGALDQVKEVVDYVTNRHGGHGAVREVCEMILKATQD